jgi:hypothetical protein
MPITVHVQPGETIVQALSRAGLMALPGDDPHEVTTIPPGLSIVGPNTRQTRIVERRTTGIPFLDYYGNQRREPIPATHPSLAFMEEIEKLIAKKMAEAAGERLRQLLGIPVGKDLQHHWFENSQLPYGYGRPDRIADCTRHQGPFRLDTEAT